MLEMGKPVVHLALAVAVVLGLTAGRCLGQKNEISAGIARWNEALLSLKLGDDQRASLAGQLNRARQALESDYLFLSLYRLHFPWVRLSAEAYQNSKTGDVKQAIDAYEKEWRRLGADLADKEKRLTPAAGRRVPAAVKALIQVSRSQSRPYYQSGRLYGLNTTLDQGLFYMGIAPGNIDFALFCQGLPFNQERPAPRLRALARELAELEAETIKAYRQSDPKDHPRYNDLNATLKVASELNQERMLEGAFCKYLEAIMSLAVLTAPPPDPGSLDALRARADAAGAQLAGDTVDHSIGLLYLQMARSALAPSEGQPDPAGLKRVAAIFEQVLPRYFKYISEVKR